MFFVILEPFPLSKSNPAICWRVAERHRDRWHTGLATHSIVHWCGWWGSSCGSTPRKNLRGMNPRLQEQWGWPMSIGGSQVTRLDGILWICYGMASKLFCTPKWPSISKHCIHLKQIWAFGVKQILTYTNSTLLPKNVQSPHNFTDPSEGRGSKRKSLIYSTHVPRFENNKPVSAFRSFLGLKPIQ